MVVKRRRIMRWESRIETLGDGIVEFSARGEDVDEL